MLGGIPGKRLREKVGMRRIANAECRHPVRVPDGKRPCHNASPVVACHISLAIAESVHQCANVGSDQSRTVIADRARFVGAVETAQVGYEKVEMLAKQRHDFGPCRPEFRKTVKQNERRVCGRTATCQMQADSGGELNICKARFQVHEVALGFGGELQPP